MNLLGYDEEITWYSARGTYITMMVDKKYPPGVVAEHSGNSVITIYKFYWKIRMKATLSPNCAKSFAIKHFFVHSRYPLQSNT